MHVASQFSRHKNLCDINSALGLACWAFCRALAQIAHHNIGPSDERLRRENLHWHFVLMWRNSHLMATEAAAAAALSMCNQSSSSISRKSNINETQLNIFDCGAK